MRKEAPATAVRFAPLAQSAWLGFAAVLAAAAGHVWPVFHGFRGGKGAATVVGGLLVVWPVALVPLLAVWVLCLTSTGYVGLSTILAACSLVATALWQGAPTVPLLFAIMTAVLITFTHRSNFCAGLTCEVAAPDC